MADEKGKTRKEPLSEEIFKKRFDWQPDDREPLSKVWTPYDFGGGDPRDYGAQSPRPGMAPYKPPYIYRKSHR